jgi:hypothetical protein
MADVDMSDEQTAGPTKVRAKGPTKAAKGGATLDSVDGKKRFEVKKVRKCWDFQVGAGVELTMIVERGCTLGVGHSRRQLRYLSESHYGSL